VTAAQGAGPAAEGGAPGQDLAGRWPRVSAVLWRRPWARASLLLTPALAWFVLIYLAALAVLMITTFLRINPFTSNIEQVWNLNNFTLIFRPRPTGPSCLRTVEDGRWCDDRWTHHRACRSPTTWPGSPAYATRTFLYVAILLPLWASYLAKVYAWLLVFTHDGLLNWSLGKVGIGPVSLIYSNPAVFIVFCYVWLPFMVVPIYAALERIPPSQIEASQDLGARTWRTTRLVILPLILPGIVAGSIFTFSLTLGDFITPILIGGSGSNFMGNVIEQSVGIANNVPFGAAMALIPTRSCRLPPPPAIGRPVPVMGAL
jgi:putative spermidine/putrescine transport system permease protein